MAWIYLIIVILIFYIPSLLSLAFVTSVPGIRVTWGIYSFVLPFSASWKLIAYSFITWLVLWIVTLFIESKVDILYEIDRRVEFVALRQRWLYASRPSFPRRLSVWLAAIGLLVSVVYGVASVASSFFIAFRSLTEAITVLRISSHVAANLFGMSLLTLLANFAFQSEIRRRYYRDIRRNQARRKEALGIGAGDGA